MAKKLTNSELDAVINLFISRLEGKISLDRVVLYGSYAKGTAHDWSDIDLMIVSKDLPRDKPKGANGFLLMQMAGFDGLPLGLEVIGVHPDALSSPIYKDFYDEVVATGQERLVA